MTAARADLVQELSTISKIASRKQTTTPILSYALLEVDDAGARLTATDLDLAVRVSFPAVGIPGAQLIPAAKLLELLRATGSEQVTLETEANGVGILADQFRARLQAMSIEDFPRSATEMDGGDPTAIMPGELIQAAIERVRFAVSSNDERFFMSGVRFERVDDVLWIVATDGHRMAVVKAPLPGPNFEMQVPRKAIDVILETVGDGDPPEVEYTDTATGLRFRIGENVVVSRKPEGAFPSWKRVLQEPSQTPAIIDRKLFTEALRRASVVGEHSHVRIDLDADGVALQATNVNLGEAAERIPVISYAGEPSQVTLNASYVADFLAVVGTDKVQYEVHLGGRITMWRPVESELDYAYVVVPIIR